MKMIYRLLFALHAFVGLGAMLGGLMAIIYPQGPAGMPVDALRNSPFTDYLIPGVILFTVIGLGNVIGAIMILLKSRFQGYISSVFGWGLVIWIIVQCIMLQAIISLHVIFFTIGLVQAALAMLLLFHQRQFPANLVIAVNQRIWQRGGTGQAS